ncbi:cytochrome c-type biogenesis protein [Acidimangrovimonas sediminis]|uniref:cytochrome c-type biogenesis protein n=1 Tax=Acidimangrovimonas sediminis TaxID=2056283 RepID=UPI000C80CBCD|nr:cytochrome c-type biogenesis protein [Acidimangrovimonas sediminis]
MTNLARIALILALLSPVSLPILLATPALAVQPDEMLKNPKLEARAREISKGLRCLVCRNEDIDESNAALAHDLRVLVRKRILAGDTNSQVVNYIVARYGEYVLLKPNTRGANLILWIAGPAMLVAGAVIAIVTQRRRRRAGESGPGLDAEEERRLAEIMRE